MVYPLLLLVSSFYSKDKIACTGSLESVEQLSGDGFIWKAQNSISSYFLLTLLFRRPRNRIEEHSQSCLSLVCL